jgi:hypothetical protein
MEVSMRRNQIPTTVGLVEEALQERGEEFTSLPMLVKITGRSSAQVSAALHHLRVHRAVDVVVEKDGTGWWFATPDFDNRLRKNQGYTEHKKPNRKSKYES